MYAGRAACPRRNFPHRPNRRHSFSWHPFLRGTHSFFFHDDLAFIVLSYSVLPLWWLCAAMLSSPSRPLSVLIVFAAVLCLLLLLCAYSSIRYSDQPLSILDQLLPASVDTPASDGASVPEPQHYRGLLLLPSDTDSCGSHPPTIPSASLAIKRNDTCAGSPSRPNRPARPLVPDIPAMYAHQPFMDHDGGVKEPTCWTEEKYELWKAGELPTYPLSKRTESLVSHIMFSVVTGRVNHRARADIIMCTYAQQLRYGQIWFHSDGEDEKRRLPLLGNVDTSGNCDHSCSERKWINGLNETLRAGLADPNVHWFMVADDDTFIALKHLADISMQYHYTMPYLIGSVHYELDGVDGKHGLYGGAGFLISRQLAINILPHFHRCFGYEHSESDLFLSRCMVDLGRAQLVDRLEMGSQPPRYYIEQKDDCVEMIRPGLSKGATYHYVRPWQEFYYLYMLYLAFVD